MPNHVPVNFPNNIAEIHAYEIAKDHNNADHPFIRAYRKETVAGTGGGDPGAKAKALIAGGPLQSNAPLPLRPDALPKSRTPLKLWPGRNLYLIRLTDENDGMAFNTRAKFGPEDPPIDLLPSRKQGRANLFRSVGVYFVRNDTLLHHPGNAMPNDLADVESDGWLGFICNFDDSNRISRMLFEQEPGLFALPIYLNLYDKVDQRPVWATNHGHDNSSLTIESHQEHGKPLVHGGIHPGGVGEYVYGGP